MKKLSTLLSILFLSKFLIAQCTISPSVFNGPTDYGIIPDTSGNLPPAYIGVPYTLDAQVHVIVDTITQIGTFPVTQVTLDSISGLPDGFSFLPNPANAIMPGGSYACVSLTGLATPGQHLGGPYSNGIYPLFVYVTGTVNLFSVPTTFPATLVGYRLEVKEPNSISEIESTRLGVSSPVPNPSDNRTEIQFTAPVHGQVDFHLYNLLGTEVARQSIVANRGNNRFSLETTTLPSGVYMCSFLQGNSMETCKLTISH